MNKHLLGTLLPFFTGLIGNAQVQDTSRPSPWSVHFQLTVISQKHAGFKAAYSGMNSLADTVEPAASSITTTLFLGRRLWKNAAIYLNPELSGGHGLSAAVGVAGALNGETYRIGDPAPMVSIARAYLQQTIPLGHSGNDNISDAANQVAGSLPSSRITFTAGKFAISDFYDKNSYSHDPRSQFFNWSLMSNGAWDYPANTKGYTMGLVAELVKPEWAIRLSSVAVPKIANQPEMEYVFGKAHSETAEFEHQLHIGQRPGVIRLLLSHTASRAPSYKGGLAALANHDTTLLKVISGNAQGTAYGGHKTGIGLGIEQQLSDVVGVFARAGWNDGKHATWAFTEIDQTLQAGLSLKGSRWHRPEDVVGIAGVINGISTDHRAFLKAGGYGFIIGDGDLNYSREQILEAYYNAKLFSNIWLTFDYQFVKNPGYNKDRGPVHVFGIRGHIEF
ncbi:MAG: carbohydrate porin [Sphingobacteriales bacterium 50-39]|nr:carbohydrate porin [Sphingobacteriales bacterium]OJW52935.1 MAG: carbohydrate porin [Sphingobacteriales bacterium 50-39]